MGILLGCPPPAYRLKFKIGDYYIQDKVVIEQDTIRMELTGNHAAAGNHDGVTIKLKIEGISIIDHGFCERILSFQSNRYRESSAYEHAFACSDDKCCLYLSYSHKQFYDMSRADFQDYLDSTYIKILIGGVIEEIQEIEVVFDKARQIKAYEDVSRRNKLD